MCVLEHKFDCKRAAIIWGMWMEERKKGSGCIGSRITVAATVVT